MCALEDRFLLKGVSLLLLDNAPDHDDDSDDDDDDDDIYIMMQCLCVCVCHEKSSLPTSGLSAGGEK